MCGRKDRGIKPRAALIHKPETGRRGLKMLPQLSGAGQGEATGNAAPPDRRQVGRTEVCMCPMGMSAPGLLGSKSDTTWQTSMNKSLNGGAAGRPHRGPEFPSGIVEKSLKSVGLGVPGFGTPDKTLPPARARQNEAGPSLPAAGKGLQVRSALNCSQKPGARSSEGTLERRIPP